jgi:hypothetical protein
MSPEMRGFSPLQVLYDEMHCDPEPPRLWIVAGSYGQARDYAVEHHMQNRPDWRYLNRADQLRGHRDPRVVWTGTFRERHDLEEIVETLRAVCRHAVRYSMRMVETFETVVTCGNCAVELARVTDEALAETHDIEAYRGMLATDQMAQRMLNRGRDDRYGKLQPPAEDDAWEYEETAYHSTMGRIEEVLGE